MHMGQAIHNLPWIIFLTKHTNNILGHLSPSKTTDSNKVSDYKHFSSVYLKMFFRQLNLDQVPTRKELNYRLIEHWEAETAE